MKFFASVFAIAFIGSAVFGQVYQPPDRQVLSLPEIKVPAEAVESGLRGTVRVAVLVDNSGGVISVGDTIGPDDVCTAVSRPDVVALRDTARSIAAGAKFSPNFDAPQPIEQPVLLDVSFPDTPGGDQTLSNDGVTKIGRAGDNNSGSPDRFTAIGNRNFEAVSPPLDTSNDSNPGQRLGLSGGVLNGKARSLPKPPYPPAARAVRASGAVTVQVLIDESGSIFTAKAVSGHPLLRSVARNAACGAQFSPTLLEGNPVKVSGVITYNFVAP